MSYNTFNVLVTGANSGLGLGICVRLIDDFFMTRNDTENLNIIYTTRSSRKGSDTLKTLKDHLARNHPPEYQKRVTFESENVDLTKLLSVRDLARRLLDSNLEKIDVVICNAGIGGWSGVDWPEAIRDVILDIRNNTTWPDFKLGAVGSLTRPQLGGEQQEPPLGEVFCANLFGHYMLVHWIMPLLRACSTEQPSKIVWVSSIEPQDYHLQESDLQGLQTSSPYESGKRLTDILALTSNQPELADVVASYTTPASKSSTKSQRPDNGPPTIHTYHPGILVTTVMPLPPGMFRAYMAGIYLARIAGANWSNVDPYLAAHGATWLAFAPQETIRKAEISASASSATPVAKEGMVKWGTSCSRWGKTTVQPTEVAGWGINGTGQPYAKSWWGGVYGSGGKYGRGRKPDAVEATGQDVEGFIKLGGRVWTAMEDLRKDWERRIEQSGL